MDGLRWHRPLVSAPDDLGCRGNFQPTLFAAVKVSVGVWDIVATQSYSVSLAIDLTCVATKCHVVGSMPKGKARTQPDRAVKGTIIRMRVSEGDKRTIEDAARREGRSLSNWLLRAALRVARDPKP